MQEEENTEPKTENDSLKKNVRLSDLRPRKFLYFYLFSLIIAHLFWWLFLKESGITSAYAVLIVDRSSDAGSNLGKGIPEIIYGLSLIIVSFGGLAAWLAIFITLFRFLQALFKWSIVYFLAGLLWLSIPIVDFILTQIALM